MTRYVLALADTNATLDAAGGKGASLARLAAEGLPVPGGFHVTTDAYRRFVADAELQAAILEIAASADPDVPAALESAARRIAARFAAHPVPADVADAIRAAYAGLGDDVPVAVRSSATAEDLPEASFAGQQDTFLDVRGAEAVVEATRRCWASLWTARAIAYRARHGIDHASVSLAVVVQEMVAADAAGILFTVDPVTGRRGEAMISAAWGLGEAVVGGHVTPDGLVVDKATGRVVRRETADKQVMTVATGGGTDERPVPGVLRRAAVLSDPQAADLARLAGRIEALYGMPMDVEWALAGGRLFVVQARPITALPDAAGGDRAVGVGAEGDRATGERSADGRSDRAVRWVRPDESMMYARGSMAEFLPEPVTPLFATLGLGTANRATADLFAWLFGGRSSVHAFQYTTVNGYVYGAMRSGVRDLVPYFWVSAVSMRKILASGVARWRDEARPAYVGVVRHWAGRKPAALPAGEVLEGVREIVEAAMKYYTTIQSGTIPSASSSEVSFTRFYELLVRRRGDPEATTFLLGFDSAPILAEKALFDLAAWCADHDPLADYLRRASAAQIAADLANTADPPDAMPIDTWREWCVRFGAYLDEHAHVAYDLDFSKPVAVEAPEPIIETVKLYLRAEGADPHERQRLAAERREAATRDVIDRLDPVRRRLFRRLLTWAQASVPVREDSIAGMGLGYAQLRRLLAELGRRLVAAGALHGPDDIYWLTEAELEQAVGALEDGDAVADRSDAVAVRRADWRAARGATPPSVLPETSIWARFLPKVADDECDVLRGIGAGAGTVTARACVLHGPDDFDQLRPGDVLVAVTTTPAWTPLFAMAGAVVTDIGGPLSHSSIVAREYGIPAVMGVGTGTRRIKTGQTITVDGAAGTVTLSRNGS